MLRDLAELRVEGLHRRCEVMEQRRGQRAERRLAHQLVHPRALAEHGVQGGHARLEDAARALRGVGHVADELARRLAEPAGTQAQLALGIERQVEEPAGAFARHATAGKRMLGLVGADDRGRGGHGLYGERAAHDRFAELERRIGFRQLFVERRHRERVLHRRGEPARGIALLETAPHDDFDLVVPGLSDLVGSVG